MKRMTSALLLMLLLLTACAAPSPQQSSPYQLYFLSSLDHGPAILTQPYTDSDHPTPEQLIQSLLSGPREDGLLHPFPQGVTLRRLTRNDDHITVDFSEQYGGLSDISLTLADYCVVLTLCQLEGVDSVEITVSGKPLSYRSHQILTREETLSAIEHPED